MDTKYLLILAFAVSASSITQAKVHTHLDLGLGKGSGALDWSIAADLSGRAEPNILSELQFKELDFNATSLGVALDFTSPHRQNYWQLSMRLSAGEHNGGRGQDSDYLGNNRTTEFSRSYSSITGDDITNNEFKISLGTQQPHLSHWLFSLGYSYQQQKIRMQEGTQAVALSPYMNMALGDFNGLNATYDASWKALFVGMGYNFKTKRNSISAGANWYWPNYDAEADWNLRGDLQHPVSFSHHSTGGNGSTLDLTYAFKVSDYVKLQLKGYWQEWQANPGTDIVYTAYYGQLQTRFNEANWSAAGWLASIVITL